MLSADLQVSIVAFTKGRLEVKSHAWNRNLGGRDFDEVLFNHFAKEFGDKHKIDIPSNPRASFRLRMACEKVICTRSCTPLWMLPEAMPSFAEAV